MSSVFVIGVGMTQFARHRERLLEDLAREAVRTAVQSTKANVRWFVGLNADEPVWDPSTFSKNRDCLLAAEITRMFFAHVVG